jgi:hypothetical protein
MREPRASPEAEPTGRRVNGKVCLRNEPLEIWSPGSVGPATEL